MEVHFTPDVEAQLHALVTETGRAADAFVQDAMGDENETCKIPDEEHHALIFKVRMPM
jgi:hypothetical protein